MVLKPFFPGLAQLMKNKSVRFASKGLSQTSSLQKHITLGNNYRF